jgi:hypothetical protein
MPPFGMTSSSEIRTREVRDETRRKAFRASFLRSSTSGPRGCHARRQRADEDTGPRRDALGTLSTRWHPASPSAVEQYADDLQGLWWARTVSNRRPLVCKAEPERPRRCARCHSILEFPAQRLVRVPLRPRIVGLCLPVLAHSWHNGGLVVRTWMSQLTMAQWSRFAYSKNLRRP